MTEHTSDDAAARHTPGAARSAASTCSRPRSRPRAPCMVDSTLGMGGHTEGVLQAFPHVRVVGIDRDTAGARARGPAARAVRRPVHRRARGLRRDQRRARRGSASPQVQGVLMDLGVSSLQLDERERGFSYAQDAPLDMRMDATTGQTAADVLNTYDERELARILREYGEERFAPRIARAIVAPARHGAAGAHRASSSSIVRANIPAATRKTGGNPAKRTFQALRIEVNGELEVLERALPAVDRGARRRRPDRRRVVPLARGPGRQARPRRRRDVERPAGPAGRARDARAVPAPRHPRRRGGRRGRARAQPALAVRPPPRRRAHPSHP